MPSSIEPTRRATERCRSVGTTEPAGNWVLAGTWAELVSSSSIASREGASQREGRDNEEFMRRGISVIEKGQYNSTLRPRGGLLQVQSPQSLVKPCAHW